MSFKVLVKRDDELVWINSDELKDSEEFDFVDWSQDPNYGSDGLCQVKDSCADNIVRSKLTMDEVYAFFQKEVSDFTAPNQHKAEFIARLIDSLSDWESTVHFQMQDWKMVADESYTEYRDNADDSLWAESYTIHRYRYTSPIGETKILKTRILSKEQWLEFRWDQYQQQTELKALAEQKRALELKLEMAPSLQERVSALEAILKAFKPASRKK
jgi:hypothetical protein